MANLWKAAKVGILTFFGILATSQEKALAKRGNRARAKAVLPGGKERITAVDKPIDALQGREVLPSG
jgi:hypothetical protein